jgi:hypothetical protein
MDWITRDRLASKATPAQAQGITPVKAQALGLPDSEAKLLPAVSGKRTLVTPAWQGSKHSAQPCISYSLSDPTPRLFAPSRERHGSKRDTVRTAVVPDVVRAGLTNNIGQDYS